LLGKLAPEDNPVDERTFKWSFILTFLVVVCIMVWGYFVDIKQGAFTAQELLNISLSVVSGIPIAVLFLIGVIILYQKIKVLHNIPLVSFIAIFGLIIPIITLLLINITNQVIDRVIIGFVFSAAFMTLLIELIPSARKFFTFESGVLPRVGVSIFLISRVIQMVDLLQ